jgi:hypothetical protein
MYQDVFDYRILPSSDDDGSLYLMIQRRDEHNGWGQPLMVDIYSNGDEKKKVGSVTIPHSCSNVYIHRLLL